MATLALGGLTLAVVGVGAQEPRPVRSAAPGGALSTVGAAASAPARTAAAWRGADGLPVLRVSAQDPADSLYRAARVALNAERWERAAELFASIRSRYPRSAYVPDTYYFQALALQRAGGGTRLERAVALLEEAARRHADAATAGDARALKLRIEGELARTGSAAAARSVATAAAGACEGEDQELRSVALNALLQMDADRAVPILQEVLQRRDACSTELRRQAVFLLSQKMTAGTVDLLLDLAARRPDPDPEVRSQAVFWLSQVQSPEAVAALEQVLRNAEDPELQGNALFALSQQGGPRAVRVLQDFARRADTPRELRQNALFWIAQNPEAGGSAWLREIYPSLEDEELRAHVVFGVAQAATPEDRSWLLERVRDADESMDVRKNALFWAGQARAVPVEDLMALYRSVPDPEMKGQVIFSLSQRAEDRAAVDALLRIAREETDTELREMAIFWLGQSDDERVADFLLELVRGGGR